MMKITRKRAAAVLVGVVILSTASCTNRISANSRIEKGPVGIGRSINELKGTPCACTEIPMKIPADMKV